MEPKNLRFGGGASETAIHPAVAIALVIACSMLLLQHRKRLFIPFLLATFLIPCGEVIVVGGVHFLTPRIVILVGLLRMAKERLSSSKAILASAFNRVDIFVTLWAVSYALAFVLLYPEWAAVINRLGFLLDALGGYFVVRYLIRDMEDVDNVIHLFALIAFCLAICMVIEQFTHRNIFGLIGGERLIPELRNGRVRSQAAFHHPLLAGAFGATMMPLFVGSWSKRKTVAAVLGIIASVVMVVTSAESTSILTLVGGILGLCLWPLRRRIRLIRWAIVVVLIALHLVMKAPVWALIARIDLTGSSTSFDRFILLDNCIRHFGDWWLLGTKDYNNWGGDMWDLCNQYVAYAETGGLATLVFFIATIVWGFKAIGRARRKSAFQDRKQEWFLWCMWAALFSHVVGYFGLGYGDQMELAWFALLAIICAAAFTVARSSVTKPDRFPDLALAASASGVTPEHSAL